MIKLLQKLTKEHLNLQQGDKKSYNKSIIKGSIIATFVAATPFLFYLYEYVPSVPVWETSYFTYRSGWYDNANTSAWVLMMKIVPLVLSLIWFMTCRHWWYHVLIVPIAMFLFQVISAINDDVVFMDEFHIVYLLPIMAIVFPSIYLIRAKMFNKINESDKTMEELEEEFMIKPKDFMGKLKQYF